MVRKKRGSPLAKSKQGQETREVNRQTRSDNFISFSFRYFQDTDMPPAQSLENWDQNNMLYDMLNSLKHMSQNNITELQLRDKKLTLYQSFPQASVNDFSLPANLSDAENWGCLRNIGGQKARIAGFLRDNVFYVVYLDKDHKFYKSKR